MAALLKIALIVASTTGLIVGLTPPAPPAHRDEKEKVGQDAASSRRLVERLAPVFPIVGKTSVVSIMLMEIIVAWSAGRRTKLSGLTLMSTLCNGSVENLQNFISPLFLLGSLTTIAGACVRAAAYRALGPMFTYELSIRRQHKLITNGPYSFVRHPSYIGGALVGTGLTMCELSRGSWWIEARVMDTWPGRLMAGLWGLGMVFGTMLVGQRVGKEDAMLRKEFGAEWDAYAAKVKYWLIPGFI